MKSKTTLLVAKGVLLWVTIFNTILFVSAVDSLNFSGLFIWLVITIILIFTCTQCMNEDEFMTVTGNKLLAKYYPEFFDEDEE